MSELKQSIEVETLANLYVLTGILGEGGAGRVYGGTDSDGMSIAIKFLTDNRREKRKRFVNESNFLRQNQHANLVPVIEAGLSSKGIVGPFYVMPRYEGSLRSSIGSLAPGDAIQLFSGILDGVEAAHLLNVVHRDLKPENILLNANRVPAIADFGIASFTEELLFTHVDTAPATRLANFQYAAPEQRTSGNKVGMPADIYALGLILNELFTGVVPHGTSYRTIRASAEQFGYLDAIVGKMIAQNPNDRHQSINDVKSDIQKYQAEAVSLQKLRRLDQIVIPAGEVDDPLAHVPPKIINAQWDGGRLTLTFDQIISSGWIEGLHNLGSYRSLMGLEPTQWQFNADKGICHVSDNSAQAAIDYFKDWMSGATAQYKYRAEQALRNAEQERVAALTRQRQVEETKMKVNTSLQF